MVTNLPDELIQSRWAIDRAVLGLSPVEGETRIVGAGATPRWEDDSPQVVVPAGEFALVVLTSSER